MPSWPPQWIGKALSIMGVPASGDAIQGMRAWSRSTPLPPLTNNPIGFPKGTFGAPAYLNTGYALFASMDDFYAALAQFRMTRAGEDVANALSASSPFAPLWRAVSSLRWPGSTTEGDYPGAVLDLTSQSYRAGIVGSDAKNRRTSGTVGASPVTRATILDHARAVHQAVATSSTSLEAVRMLIQRGK